MLNRNKFPHYVSVLIKGENLAGKKIKGKYTYIHGFADKNSALEEFENKKANYWEEIKKYEGWALDVVKYATVIIDLLSLDPKDHTRLEKRFCRSLEVRL